MLDNKVNNMKGDEGAVLQSLLLTALGGVLGVGGALLASQFQAREGRRVRREQDARDDRYRLSRERIDAYKAFYIAAGSARHAIDAGLSIKKVQERRQVLWEAFTLVALIGDANTWDHARTVLRVISDVAFDGSSLNVDEWNELIRVFIQSSRLELIPDKAEYS